MGQNLEHDRRSEELSYQDSTDRHFERLDFVKHVCDIMIESRYEHATRRHWFVFDDDIEGIFKRKPLCETPCKTMPDAAFDLMPGDPFGQISHERTNIELLPGQATVAIAVIDSASPAQHVPVANLARGSPKSLGRSSSLRSSFANLAIFARKDLSRKERKVRKEDATNLQTLVL